MSKTLKSTKEALTTFAKTSELALSERIRRFWSEQIDLHDGRELWGLPSYRQDSKIVVRFVKPGFELFDEHEVSRTKNPTLVPLAELANQSQFLVVDAVDPSAPVSMWDHEDGKFYAVVPSLDALMARFDEPLPARPATDALQTANFKARLLLKSGDAAGALAMIERALAPFPPSTFPGDPDGIVALGYERLGGILLKLGREADAIAALENSLRAGQPDAAPDLLALYEAAGRDVDVVRVASAVAAGELEDDDLFDAVHRHLGRSRRRLGDDGWQDSYRALHGRFAGDADRIAAAREELAALGVDLPWFV